MTKKIAAIQMTSIDAVDANLATAERLLAQAAASKAALTILPENFAFIRKSFKDPITIQEDFGVGKIQNFLAEQARKHQMWIVGGTIPIAVAESHKIYAACLVYDSQGNCVARYDKIHLFDVTIGQERHEESKLIHYGKMPVVVDTPVGRLGLAICYDVRFPELFRYLLTKGAEIFALPSAFTVPTGQAHWEVLTRSRAIENLSYFVASCQYGKHNQQRSTYGHSLIIDPWGKILTCLPEGEGVISAEINLDYLHQLREQMPIIKHRRDFLTHF